MIYPVFKQINELEFYFEEVKHAEYGNNGRSRHVTEASPIEALVQFLDEPVSEHNK